MRVRGEEKEDDDGDSSYYQSLENPENRRRRTRVLISLSQTVTREQKESVLFQCFGCVLLAARKENKERSKNLEKMKKNKKEKEEKNKEISICVINVPLMLFMNIYEFKKIINGNLWINAKIN